jgi:hypothetical protein
MWNFLWRGGGKQQRNQRQQQDELEFNWTIIAPQPRGQEATMALRENADDLGATVALQQAIDASRTLNRRELSSHTTASLRVPTNVSSVSEDSEDYVTNPYTDTGRRWTRRQQQQPQQRGPSASTPLALVSSTQDPDPLGDFVDVKKPDSEEKKPQNTGSNLLMDPVGTLLHLTAAATLAYGPPRPRQYITSGPPPPDQRGGRAQADSQAQTGSQAQLPSLATPAQPRPPRRALTPRRRAASSPAVPMQQRHSVCGSVRSTRSL